MTLFRNRAVTDVIKTSSYGKRNRVPIQHGWCPYKKEDLETDTYTRKPREDEGKTEMMWQIQGTPKINTKPPETEREARNSFFFIALRLN